MIAAVCEQLVAAGLPLWRFGIFIRTLHPEIFGRNFIWRQGQKVEIGTVDFEILDTPEFAKSPLRSCSSRGSRCGAAWTTSTASDFRSSRTCAPKA